MLDNKLIQANQPQTVSSIAKIIAGALAQD